MGFSWVKTIPGYKLLYTGLDLASIVVLLLLLAIRAQPLARVLMHAWNPTVVVSFALDAHHDSLAILTLLAALFFIISERLILSIVFLALSLLSKFFALPLLPVFLKCTRWKLLNSLACPLRRRPALPGFSTHPSAGVRAGTRAAGVGRLARFEGGCPEPRGPNAESRVIRLAR
jgi:hypothetical protein